MKWVAVVLLMMVIGGGKGIEFPEETTLAKSPIISIKKQSVVFITGLDEGDNSYYAQAQAYFKAQGFPVVDHLFSLEALVQWLNQEGDKGTEFEEVHIVSHGNPWLGMSLKTTEHGDRVSLKSLSANTINAEIGEVSTGICPDTRIVFHSCGLAENRMLLGLLKQVFGGAEIPKVVASPWFAVFGSKYAPYYLAQSYYGFYPTAQSPGPLALARQFKAKYPEEDINWFTALKTRKENGLGVPYSYKFNIPLHWEFTFDTVSEIPKLVNANEIMDWLLTQETAVETIFTMGIPMEHYRWRTRITGNTLFVEGKTTALCVLKPIMDKKDGGEYRLPDMQDQELYQIL
ncbi:MAG: hypothetical protein AAGA86_09445 [Bacteroidota bacterium]